MVDPLSPISANNIVTVSNPRTLSCLAKVGLRTLLLFFVDAPPPAPADDDEVAAPARLNPTPPPAPRADPPRFGDKAVPPEIDCRLMVWLAAVTASTNVAPMFEAREDIGAVVLAVVVPVGWLPNTIEVVLDIPPMPIEPALGVEGKCMTLLARLRIVPNRGYDGV